MRFAIRTLQVPGRWGMGAFAPTMTTTGSAVSNGQNQIDGAPGTIRIPCGVGTPFASMGGGPGDNPDRWLTSPSACAPDWFLPSIYTFRANRSVHFPGRLFGDNVMPVPIPNIGRVANQPQHRFRLGGRTVTSNMRPFTQWPSYRRSSS